MDQPQMPAETTWVPALEDVARTATVALCAYHGSRRHGSLSWALLWSGAGSLFPIPTLLLAVFQGFGKPEHGEPEADGGWHYASRYLVTMPDGRLTTTWADDVQHALQDTGGAEAKRIPSGEWSAPLKPDAVDLVRANGLTNFGSKDGLPQHVRGELDYELTRKT